MRSHVVVGVKPLGRAILVVGLLACLGCGSGTAAASQREFSALTISIEDVSSRGGDIRVALYDRASYAGHDQKPILATVVEAKAPETVVVLTNVPTGTYALKLFQDFNRSGTFVVNKLGLPEEPFGFSNDALPILDQPSFDAAKFSLTNGAMRIVVHLRSAF